MFLCLIMLGLLHCIHGRLRDEGLGSVHYIKSQIKNGKTCRDEIPKKQSNKVGTNDTTVPLRTPIPISISLDIFPTTRMHNPLHATSVSKHNNTRFQIIEKH